MFWHTYFACLTHGHFTSQLMICVLPLPPKWVREKGWVLKQVLLYVYILFVFVVFGFFFKAVIVTSVKSLGYSPVSCMLISCFFILRPSSPNSFEYISRYVIIPSSHLIPQLFDSFSHFTVQNTRASLIFIHFFFSFYF